MEDKIKIMLETGRPDEIQIPEEHHATIDILMDDVKGAEQLIDIGNEKLLKARTAMWDWIHANFPETESEAYNWSFISPSKRLVPSAPGYQSMIRDLGVLKKILVGEQAYDLAAQVRNVEKAMRENQKESDASAGMDGFMEALAARGTSEDRIREIIREELRESDE